MTTTPTPAAALAEKALPKACPFCEHTDIVTLKSSADDYWQHCEDCDVSGPHALSVVQSIERWNNRPAFQALMDEKAELEKLVYVPGVWKCAKCGCVLISTELNASSGQARANTQPQRCPNDCGPMWRRTEREAGNELCDRLDTACDKARVADDRIALLERDKARMREVLEQIAAESPMPDDFEFYDNWNDPTTYQVRGVDGAVHEAGMKTDDFGDWGAHGFARGIHAMSVKARSAIQPEGEKS